MSVALEGWYIFARQVPRELYRILDTINLLINADMNSDYHKSYRPNGNMQVLVNSINSPHQCVKQQKKFLKIIVVYYLIP